MKEQLVTHAKKIYDGVNACTSITVHETANTDVGADAQAHADLQTNGTVRQASWHITVDDVEAIRSFPNTAQCWHAGTDEGNRNSVAVEICVNADGDYDKAFKIAAATVADLRQELGLGRDEVLQHHAWTGKDCPNQMRAAGRWQEFLDLTGTVQKEGTMINPVPGWVSSEWSRNRVNPATGVRTSHAGIDIAAPIGTLVRAAFAGRVISVRTGSYNGDPHLWKGVKSGNHVLIENSDGACQYYGHLNTTGEYEGDWVEAGEIIGTVGKTGQVTGPHLHFECWSNDDLNSHFNPRILFERYGLEPGVDNTELAPAASITPIKKDWFDMASEADIRNIVREEIRDALRGVGQTVAAHKFAAFRANDKDPKEINLAEGARTSQRVEKISRETRALVQSIAQKNGLTGTEIGDIVRDAVAESVVTVDVSVAGKNPQG
ncbi:peptidoglycan DD-metalloendopeptidase family protein [Micrococcaceae bacterium RIT802]|nr:peptidoglycan DD-metalloendopeptidase family protein [Micrococcaceae bacterium RIT 802]